MHYFKPWFFVIAVGAFLAGCKKAYIQFGDQFVDNEYTNIILVDTITPVLSTLFLDSIITSQTGTLMVGRYNDPIFGQISSSTFLVISSPDNIPEFHISAVYDSLEFRMVADSSFYGDTAIRQTISVQQLAERIEFPEGSTSLYSKADFLVETVPLGVSEVSVAPSNRDTLRIRMSDSKGNEIWNLLREKATAVASATDFEHYFRGLKLSTVSGAGNAAIFGFSDTVVMRLHYHETNPGITEKYIDFPITARNKQFNQVLVDRTGTPLDVELPESKEIVSSQLGNAAYIQPLTGVLTKIAFPNIREAILQREEYLQLMSAELVLKPIGGSYGYANMLPPQLAAYTTDRTNIPGTSLGLSGSTSSTETQYGSLQIDWLNGELTQYAYDVTVYLQQQLTLSGDNTNALLLLPPSPAFNTRLNRAAIGDRRNEQAKAILKIYYIAVQQQN